MSCTGCGSRGLFTNEGIDEMEVNNGCNKLDSFDWLKDLPAANDSNKYVEIRFKNTRKEYYHNKHQLVLKIGDTVAVEAQYGHDIGIVSLTGTLAERQMKKRKDIRDNAQRIVYRLASPTDVKKWQEAQRLEHTTLIRTRSVIKNLGLDMKLSDVEYQGDKTKATFFYIADGRVDFRQLIKELAQEFSIKVEMRQIGARQEAAMVGGIGSCGRELCCSTWKTNFTSVPTNAAKYQELSSNAQKLAGQCGKLKCCLMYELDTYLENWEHFPKEVIVLETQSGLFYPLKTEVMKKKVWYSSSENTATDVTSIDVKRVKEIIAMNKRGQKPESLTDAPIGADKQRAADKGFVNVIGDDDIKRFDKKKPQIKHRRRKKANRSHNKRNNR